MPGRMIRSIKKNEVASGSAVRSKLFNVQTPRHFFGDQNIFHMSFRSGKFSSNGRIFWASEKKIVFFFRWKYQNNSTPSEGICQMELFKEIHIERQFSKLKSNLTPRQYCSVNLKLLLTLSWLPFRTPLSQYYKVEK